MYNSIYPININYNKNIYRNKLNDKNNGAKNASMEADNKNDLNSKPQSKPQATPYSNGQINISQVLADFKNTIIAINAPKEVQDEVNLYLNLVEREAQKENPSKDIIYANLTNASKVSDNYIAKVLNKQSNVVEGWITTLFQQKINLKADPKEINPDFLLKFPQKAQEKIEQTKSTEETPSLAVEVKDEPLKEVETKEVQIEEVQEETIEEETPKKELYTAEKISVDSSLELSQPKVIQIQNKPKIKTPFSPFDENDKKARELLIKAKKHTETPLSDADSLNMLNEAIGMVENNNGNSNIKAAIHLERGKIFDNYDYINYALRDYLEATKADDLNLKSQAYYRLAGVYDEFREFDPALDNYLSSVAYSGEADNLKAQVNALSKIASMYTKQFDLMETINYTDLAIETALDTNNKNLIANTYSTGAQNFQYLGENVRALDNYKNAIKAFLEDKESYEQMAYNYEQASITMEKLGNKAKAEKLQLKANQYYQKAQQSKFPQEAVS